MKIAQMCTGINTSEMSQRGLPHLPERVAKERGKSKSVKWLMSVAGAVSHWKKSSSKNKPSRLESMDKEIDTLLSAVIQPRAATHAVIAVGRMQK